MKDQSWFAFQRIPISATAAIIAISTMLFAACTEAGRQHKIEEITFHSGPFKIVGDLSLPEGSGPHPAVIFVHGDGPNDRTSGVTYPPIMERMERAGYATFAWDKPGTGESSGRIDRSRLGEERSQIVLEAIAVLKERADIDGGRIGLWGISQAGFVMPRVLAKGGDVAFMIAVGCPCGPGVEQGAYLVSAQARCAGVSRAEAERMRDMLTAIEKARTYEEYVEYKKQLDELPGIEAASIFGFKKGVQPESEWHPPNLAGEYFWDPREVIEKTTIPVLAVFGERDTQVDPFLSSEAYRDALMRAGNPHFRVEIIPGTDHNIILSKTGCIEERNSRSRSGWTNYSPQYLDLIEEWLRGLPLPSKDK